MVELPKRKVVDKHPGHSAIPADVQPAVVAVDEEIRVIRVNVKRMVIRVHSAVRQDGPERLAAVLTEVDHGVQIENALLIRGIGVNVRVVKRSIPDLLPLNQRPIQPAIGGMVQARLTGFNQSVHHVRIGRADGQTDAAQLAGGQPFVFGQLFPVVAAVVGDIQAAAFATAGEKPRLTAVRPQSCDQFVRVRRIDDHVGHASALVDVELVRPGFAAVGGFVNAAVGAIAPSRPDGADPHGLVVGRVHDDPVDVARAFEAHQFPRGAAINAAVHPTAAGMRIPRVAFSGSHPNHVGIGRSNGEGADALGRLIVEQRLPFHAGCDRPPKAPTRGSDVNDFRSVPLDIDGGDAPTHGAGADVANVHAFDDGVDILSLAWDESHRQKEQDAPDFEFHGAHHN